MNSGRVFYNIADCTYVYDKNGHGQAFHRVATSPIVL
jgi:hypothetical protein